MYAPLQQEADRFKAGRSAVLPQIGRFCFKCPTNSLKITDVYPMSTRRNARGARACGFLPLCAVHPEGYPFRMSKGRETPAARALCGFFLSRMLGIWYRHAGGASARFRRCEQMWSSSSPLEAARETAEGPPARRRSKPKERKFQKGE